MSDLVAKASNMTTRELLAILRSGNHPMMTVLAGVQHDERCLAAADRIEALEAENEERKWKIRELEMALHEAERTAWEPPPEAERSNGYECLGQNSYNIWRHMQWSKRNGWTVRGTFDHITPNAFAPLPEARHE